MQLRSVPQLDELTELATESLVQHLAFEHRAGDGPKQPAITDPATAD